MGERKVLNYYIPYDFDASIIPKGARDRSKPIEVRTMLAFSIQCNTCGEYMYRGKKFNSKCERLENETYLGIKKFRFYIKCSVCSAEIIFKTDPKNSDYEMESGATRNFELWRETKEELETLEQQRLEEDKCDSMKALENRTLDNKIEMDVLDALDEIKAINKRHERVDTNKLLNSIGSSSSPSSSSGVVANNSSATADSSLSESDEALIKSIQFKSNKRKVDVLNDRGVSIGDDEVVEIVEDNKNSIDDVGPNVNKFNAESNHSLLKNKSKAPIKTTNKSSGIKLNSMMMVKKRRVDDTAVTNSVPSISSVNSAVPVSSANHLPTPAVGEKKVTKTVLPLGDYSSSDSD